MTEFKIVEYDKFKAQMGELEEIANHLPDVSSKDGYDKAKRIHLDFRKIENALESARKDKKSYYLEGGKEVDKQAKSIMCEIEGLRIPHTEAYQAKDKIRKDAEAKRKADIETRVAYLRDLPEHMNGLDSSSIQEALEDVQQNECLDFYEFTESALKARSESIGLLANMHSAALKSEMDAAELAKLQKEQAEREKKEREDKIAKDAAASAEAEKLAAVERERLAKERAVEAEAGRKQDTIDAENRAKAAKIEADKRAEMAAENARLAEIARQEAETKKEAAALKAREENKAHIGRIMKASKESIMALGFEEVEAKKVVLAIRKGQVENVTINI